MLRRGLWLLMLAVIAGTQVYTVACDVRCGKAAIADITSHSPGNLAQSSFRGGAALLPVTKSRCKDLLCKADWASLTLPYIAGGQDVAGLQARLGDSAVLVVFREPSLEVWQRRCSCDVFGFDPVLSSLRI
jgi:hypothetical protein